MQKLIFLIVFLSISFTLFAQNRKILTPDGKLHSINEVEKIKQFNKGNIRTKEFTLPNDISDIIDTLRYPGPWNINFGFFGQDWLLQWFQAPIDLILKKVGFACYENNDNMDVEVKVVKVNWTIEELMNAEILQRGYYEALGNGYNDITSFLDNPDRTGGWTSIQPGDTEPFGEDIWSFDGTGFQITPVGNPIQPTYQWVDLNVLEESEVSQGEIFGIAIKHTGTVMDQNRIGFWGNSDNTLGWKFYANGKLDPGVDFGWWTIGYTLDFVAEVMLISDPWSPIIVNYTKLGTTISTEPRLVEAEVIGYPAVDKVWLIYSDDGGANWTEIEMTGNEPNYSGYIPGMPPGTEVTYKIKATDVNGNTAVTLPVVYNIFEVLNTNLVVFNGYRNPDGYPQDYYFGPDIQNGLSTFAHDTWSYGALQEEVVEFYDNIFEFSTNGPNEYNDSVITNWLAADGSRNYFLAGQEWLGLRYFFEDKDFVAGDFEYDVLGITHSYNDVSFDGSGQGITSLVLPVAGTMFGGPLLDLFNSLDPPADSMMYNPVFEISVDNWIDAFDVETDVEVDMNVETRGIGGVPDVQILPTMAHRTLPAGNKIVFVAYDPISLNTANDDDFPYFFWIGFDEANSPFQALNWFGIDIVTDVRESNIVIPTEFSLSQNYPNPFNPTTKIKFTIPAVETGHAPSLLKVYDVLGNEVATLVNEEKPAGNYEVEFDAAGLPSGIYFYRLRAGSFVQTKKMILLK